MFKLLTEIVLFATSFTKTIMFDCLAVQILHAAYINRDFPKIFDPKIKQNRAREMLDTAESKWQAPIFYTRLSGRPRLKPFLSVLKTIYSIHL